MIYIFMLALLKLSNSALPLLVNVLSFVTQATAEANNLAAVAGAKDMYNKNMEQVLSGSLVSKVAVYVS